MSFTLCSMCYLADPFPGKQNNVLVFVLKSLVLWNTFHHADREIVPNAVLLAIFDCGMLQSGLIVQHEIPRRDSLDIISRDRRNNHSPVDAVLGIGSNELRI